MTENGWVKIHRNILKNPWMHNADVLGIWLYILLNVAYQNEDVVFEGKRITLQPGQGLFKMRQVAKILGVSHSKLNRTITLFKSETQIETQTSPRNTLITVVNWNKYQLRETQNETQAEHKRNTSGTQAEHLPIKERIEEVKNKRNINNTNVLFVDPADDEHQKNGDYQSIMDEWNSLPVKSIVAIRGKRLAMLRARIKDYGYDDVLNAIKMIRHSPFLLGQNKQGWQIYFDWFIKPNNFLKVLEGNYDDRQRTAPTGKNDMQAGFNEAMRILNLEVNDG